MFGAGIYFAENSSKSNQYVYGIGGGTGCPTHKDRSCYICHRWASCLLCNGCWHQDMNQIRVSGSVEITSNPQFYSWWISLFWGLDRNSWPVLYLMKDDSQAENSRGRSQGYVSQSEATVSLHPGFLPGLTFLASDSEQG